MKCLKYEHLHYMCKEKLNYQICAKDHETKLHKYYVCESTKVCAHVSFYFIYSLSACNLRL